MPSTSIDVTPAGTGLFQVDPHEQGQSTARDGASGVSPTTGQHTSTRDHRDQDDKLLEQVREEQQRGEVSSQPKRA